jgi:hypothetical protein
METIGLYLLRLFGCYFCFKEGDISWRGGFMSQERLERVGAGNFPVCVHLKACGNFMIGRINAIGDS